MALETIYSRRSIRKYTDEQVSRYNIEQIIDACKYYYSKTGRRITFEYSLIENINDSEECARTTAFVLIGSEKKERLLEASYYQNCFLALFWFILYIT